MVILYTIMATINRKRHAKIALILKNPIAATLVVSMGQMSAVMLGEIASQLHTARGKQFWQTLRFSIWKLSGKRKKLFLL